MTRRRAILPAILSLAAIAGLASAEEKSIRGQVVDDAGRPVTGMEVSADWTWSNKDRRFLAGKALETDATGSFAGKFEVKRDPFILMALSKDRKVGGAMVLDASGKGKSVSLRTAPLVALKATFVAEGFAEPPKAVVVRVLLNAGRAEMLSVEQPTGQPTSLSLPPGDYQLVAECPGATGSKTARFTLAAGQTAAELGTIKFEPGVPELKFTEARGVPKDFKLSDLKGKWVIVDFWGYWCGPCVGRSLPSLMKFYETHAADRDKFAIITFHRSRGNDQSLAAIDPEITRLEEQRWKRKLPFPILVEQGNSTVTGWGIRAFPTAALINPQGKLVALQNFGVEELLEAELAKARK